MSLMIGKSSKLHKQSITKFISISLIFSYAHNGANKRIQLIDEFGCPVDDKLISRFRGSWSDSGIFETQVYAYMKTFRFTGSPALYIECDVRMCHGRCPVSSQLLGVFKIENKFTKIITESAMSLEELEGSN